MTGLVCGSHPVGPSYLGTVLALETTSPCSSRKHKCQQTTPPTAPICWHVPTATSCPYFLSIACRERGKGLNHKKVIQKKNSIPSQIIPFMNIPQLQADCEQLRPGKGELCSSLSVRIHSKSTYFLLAHKETWFPSTETECSSLPVTQ